MERGHLCLILALVNAGLYAASHAVLCAVGAAFFVGVLYEIER